MKVPFLLALALCFAFSTRGQTPGGAYSPEQLDQLLGPIALYPDPLVAVILPASTVPSDIALAAGYLAAGGAPGGIDSQPWDPSVRALAHYPDVLKWMNDNLDWTQALGAAFAQQPSDVMMSVQQLRVRARAAGTLVDTPQQRIDMEGDDIRIVPVQPNTIYVPEYDPNVVYESPVGYAGPFVTFGMGYPAGAWLGYQCDWDDFGIWVGPWSPGWAYARQWQHPGSGANSWRAWRPDLRRSSLVVRNFYRPEVRLPSPGVIPGYRAPVSRMGGAPRPAVSRAPSLPDYRGRAIAAPRPSNPAPAAKLLDGYNRGTQTRDFSNRGQTSRSAPVRTPAPSRAPSRAAAPAPARAAPPARAPSSAPADSRERR